MTAFGRIDRPAQVYGGDLVLPHHENEIVQSEVLIGCFLKKLLAVYPHGDSQWRGPNPRVSIFIAGEKGAEGKSISASWFGSPTTGNGEQGKVK